ncbi:MAG: Mut7-C RNAse domain-containing protein [Thaumarchaeota archaeon]|nr:Mut7-C RNAse domain-containing protein [Nitrososphaerota archaeon]
MSRQGPGRRRPTKFIADAMLGSLARKLRALGFDTTYHDEGGDAGIMKSASAQRRIILTADRDLAGRARSAGIKSYLLTGRTDGRRLAALVLLAKASGHPLTRGTSRCSVCDGRLARLSREKVGGSVPPSVQHRHRLFYRCTKCGRYYWRGGHWKKLRWLERVLG